MSHTAIERACQHMSDAFRAERQAHEQVLLKGHQIKALVEGGRYTAIEAMNTLKVSLPELLVSFQWLLEDNARLNADHDTDCHYHKPYVWHMIGWCDENLPNHNVLNLDDYRRAV